MAENYPKIIKGIKRRLEGKRTILTVNKITGERAKHTFEDIDKIASGVRIAAKLLYDINTGRNFKISVPIVARSSAFVGNRSRQEIEWQTRRLHSGKCSQASAEKPQSESGAGGKTPAPFESVEFAVGDQPVAQAVVVTAACSISAGLTGSWDNSVGTFPAKSRLPFTRRAGVR